MSSYTSKTTQERQRKERLSKYRDAGFSSSEIKKWEHLLEAGYTRADIENEASKARRLRLSWAQQRQTPSAAPPPPPTASPSPSSSPSPSPPTSPRVGETSFGRSRSPSMASLSLGLKTTPSMYKLPSPSPSTQHTQRRRASTSTSSSYRPRTTRTVSVPIGDFVRLATLRLEIEDFDANNNYVDTSVVSTLYELDKITNFMYSCALELIDNAATLPITESFVAFVRFIFVGSLVNPSPMTNYKRSLRDVSTMLHNGKYAAVAAPSDESRNETSLSVRLAANGGAAVGGVDGAVRVESILTILSKALEMFALFNGRLYDFVNWQLQDRYRTTCSGGVSMTRELRLVCAPIEAITLFKDVYIADLTLRIRNALINVDSPLAQLSARSSDDGDGETATISFGGNEVVSDYSDESPRSDESSSPLSLSGIVESSEDEGEVAF